MCEQLLPKQQKIFSVHPKERLPVGYLLEDNTQILVSEAKSQSGIYYSLWIPVGRGRTYEIDSITQNTRGTWDYKRRYKCDNLEDAVRTFLKLVNPNSTY